MTARGRRPSPNHSPAPPSRFPLAGRTPAPSATHAKSLAGDSNYEGKTEVPGPLPDTTVLVNAGGNHTCPLGDAGDVTCWGDDTLGQTTAPEPGTTVHVSTGRFTRAAGDVAIGRATRASTVRMTLAGEGTHVVRVAVPVGPPDTLVVVHASLADVPRVTPIVTAARHHPRSHAHEQERQNQGLVHGISPLRHQTNSTTTPSGRRTFRHSQCQWTTIKTSLRVHSTN